MLNWPSRSCKVGRLRRSQPDVRVTEPRGLRRMCKAVHEDQYHSRCPKERAAGDGSLSAAAAYACVVVVHGWVIQSLRVYKPLSSCAGRNLGSEAYSPFVQHDRLRCPRPLQQPHSPLRPFGCFCIHSDVDTRCLVTHRGVKLQGRGPDRQHEPGRQLLPRGWLARVWHRRDVQIDRYTYLCIQM